MHRRLLFFNHFEALRLIGALKSHHVHASSRSEQAEHYEHGSKDQWPLSRKIDVIGHTKPPATTFGLWSLV